MISLTNMARVFFSDILDVDDEILDCVAPDMDVDDCTNIHVKVLWNLSLSRHTSVIFYMRLEFYINGPPGVGSSSSSSMASPSAMRPFSGWRTLSPACRARTHRPDDAVLPQYTSGGRVHYRRLPATVRADRRR